MASSKFKNKFKLFSVSPKASYLSDPDVQLMLDFKKGNKSSFEALMRRHFSHLLNFIYRFIGDREIAEDLTQEVFIRVYKNASHYNPQSKFQTWLFTIAKNLSLNELRRNKRLMVSLDETFDWHGNKVVRQVADKSAPAPDREMARKELAETVKEAIGELPENQRMAVILRRYENLSYEEIAFTMKVSVKAVKSLLSRAKGNLKNKLMKWQDIY